MSRIDAVSQLILRILQASEPSLLPAAAPAMKPSFLVLGCLMCPAPGHALSPHLSLMFRSTLCFIPPSLSLLLLSPSAMPPPLQYS